MDISMHLRYLASLAAAGGLLLSAGRASAQSEPGAAAEPAPGTPIASAPANASASAPARPLTDLGFTTNDAQRAHFSGGRYLAEVVVSGLGGALAGYATYKGVCGSGPCVGGALAGGGVELVAVPVLTMGTGALMGGRGGFVATALVGLLGFTATAPLSAKSPGAALGVSMALMPLLAPLGYELSSNVRASDMDKALQTAHLTPVLQPLRIDQRLVGAAVGLAGSW